MKDKDRKQKINLFSFYDKPGIERYLSEQAAEGWMVDSVSSLSFGFHRIEPAKIQFTVAFFAKASRFDEEPSEEQLDFEDMCRETGWKLAVSNKLMPIYYNTADPAEPIRTDPVLEVKSINDVAQRGYLLSYYLLIMLSMFWLAIFIRDLFAHPVDSLLSNTQFLSFIMFLVLWGGILAELVRYHRWYRAARRIAAEENRFLNPRGYSKRSAKIFLLSCLLLIALQLTSVISDYRIALITALFLFLQFLLFFAAFKGASHIRNREFAERKFFFYYMGTLVVAYIGLFVLLWVVLIRVFIPAITGPKPQGTYNDGTTTYQVYRDDLPLRVEDMIPVSYEGYSYRIVSRADSVFLSRIEADQSPQKDNLYAPSIVYTITKVRLPFLYGMVKSSLLEDFKNTFDDSLTEECLRIDESAWGATEAYRLRYDGELMDRFFLCYDRCFVEIVFYGNGFTFSPAETSVVGEKLSK